MTDFATFIVPALLVFCGGVSLLLLLAPLWMHLGWRRDRQGRGGWYLR